MIIQGTIIHLFLFPYNMGHIICDILFQKRYDFVAIGGGYNADKLQLCYNRQCYIKSNLY